MIENKYIKTNIQKYFWSDVWRTIEQAETSNFINYPWRYQQNLIVTLLDLRNSFREVEHDFIQTVLSYHHIPRDICNLKTEL